MADFPDDIFTEPAGGDPDTLARTLAIPRGQTAIAAGQAAPGDATPVVKGRKAPFTHRDVNTLVKVAEPTPNPLMPRES